MLARAKWVRERLGVTSKPQPVTIQNCPPPPKPQRKPTTPPKNVPVLPPLSEAATKALRTPEMQAFIDRNYDKSRKAMEWFLQNIEKWIEVQKIPRPDWVKDKIRNFCRYHGIPAIVLFSDSRIPEVVDLRGALWARIHQSRPKPSYPTIARWFKRDHTTVLYGIVRHNSRKSGQEHPMVVRKRREHIELAQRMRERRREERLRRLEGDNA